MQMLLTRIIIAMALMAIEGLAQSIYTPYIFTTIAGNAGYGSADGTGSAARFTDPSGLTVDSAGNIYVADTANHAIRKVTPAGVVTTLAGLVTFSGSTDGLGRGARFNSPQGVAVDSRGAIYVADTFNYTIRKITPDGVVTTLAGVAGERGVADGPATLARFGSLYGGPGAVAVDAAGNVYVADSGNYTIRKIAAAGIVTTLAG